MNLNRLYLTNNECYRVGKVMVPKGIMVHSTGVNNPYLRRYVGPDDGKLGENRYGNHWNRFRPDGRQVCVHAFIGKLADGAVATYQTLPWNYVGWHSGNGHLGKLRNANNSGFIGFEICEDGLEDGEYFRAIYREAVELCAYLCRKFGLSAQDIIDHSEGHRLGIASNHADVGHWFKRHGKDMDRFRENVSDALKPARLYGVQIGAFKSRENAEKVLEQVKAAGFKGAFIKIEVLD